MFSSQDEDEDEESAFESIHGAGHPPEGQEVGVAGGERRTGRWKEAGRGEQGEPAVAGPSDRNNFGERKHDLLIGCLLESQLHSVFNLKHALQQLELQVVGRNVVAKAWSVRALPFLCQFEFISF